jgi:hypothetical protein
MGNHDIRLAPPALLMVFGNVKTQKSTNSLSVLVVFGIFLASVVIAQAGPSEPNGKIGPQSDPMKFAAPATPQPSQAVAKTTQAAPRAQAGAFGNLVLVSWLEDAGKNVIYVQNTETNDVQKITSEPNLDNFRIVELHPNADPKLFEAVISNGSKQGPVRFRF